LIDRKVTDNNLAFGIIKAGVEVYIDTANALDVEQETERLRDQIQDTKDYIALLDKKLLNEAFVNKAPEKLVRAEIDKKEQAKHKLQKLEEKLSKFN
jgi:valyl-tRNA synthetase